VRKFRIMLCTVVPALALGALVPASAPAASDMFFQAEGLLGESQSDRYRDAIEPQSFSWNVSTNPKPVLSDIHFTKTVDNTSPTLLTYLTTGKVIPRAKLTFVKAGIHQQAFLRYCFTGLRVTSLSTSASNGSGALPSESVSFSYATVVEAYHRQNADGSLAPAVFGGWDLINKLQFGDDNTCPNAPLGA
jgi:type VI secretion system secreted protein Hcp